MSALRVKTPPTPNIEYATERICIYIYIHMYLHIILRGNFYILGVEGCFILVSRDQGNVPPNPLLRFLLKKNVHGLNILDSQNFDGIRYLGP